MTNAPNTNANKQPNPSSRRFKKGEEAYTYITPLHLLFLGAIAEYFDRIQIKLKESIHGKYIAEAYSYIAANPPTYDILFGIVQEWIDKGVSARLPKTTQPNEHGVTRSAALGRDYLEALEAAKLVRITEGDRKSWKAVVTQSGAVISSIVRTHVTRGVTHLWRDKITFSPLIALTNGGKKTTEAFAAQMFLEGINGSSAES